MSRRLTLKHLLATTERDCHWLWQHQLWHTGWLGVLTVRGALIRPPLVMQKQPSNRAEREETASATLREWWGGQWNCTKYASDILGHLRLKEFSQDNCMKRTLAFCMMKCFPWYWVKMVALNCGWFCSPENIWQYLETCFDVCGGVLCATRLYCVEVKVVAKCPIMHRSSPNKKESSSPKCQQCGGWETLV